MEKLAGGPIDWMIRAYGGSLWFFLRHRWISAVGWVACLAGTAFGAHGEGFLRFSYANSVEAIRDALDAIETSLPELTG